MIKVVLFDVDGVVLKKGKYKYFSERYAEEHSVPLDKISVFFKNEYRGCATGEADLKEILPSYLEEWGWKGSVDDFLEYWFSSDCELNTELLEEAKRLRNGGVTVALATNNEKYRMEYLWETAGLKNHFDKAFASCYIGHKKPTSEFFEAVMKELPEVGKGEVLFWDSDEEIVEGAREFGIKAEHYTSLEDFQDRMSLLLH